MFWIAFSIYTIFAAGVWIFFLIARMHTYQFRGYSFHIVPVTRALFFVLLALTILGYFFVMSIEENPPRSTDTVEETVRGRIY